MQNLKKKKKLYTCKRLHWQAICLDCSNTKSSHCNLVLIGNVPLGHIHNSVCERALKLTDQRDGASQSWKDEAQGSRCIVRDGTFTFFFFFPSPFIVYVVQNGPENVFLFSFVWNRSHHLYFCVVMVNYSWYPVRKTVLYEGTWLVCLYGFVFSRTAWPERPLLLEVGWSSADPNDAKRNCRWWGHYWGMNRSPAGHQEANIGSGCADVGALFRPRASVCACGCLWRSLGRPWGRAGAAAAAVDSDTPRSSWSPCSPCRLLAVAALEEAGGGRWLGQRRWLLRNSAFSIGRTTGGWCPGWRPRQQGCRWWRARGAQETRRQEHAGSGAWCLKHREEIKPFDLNLNDPFPFLMVFNGINFF